MGGIHKPKPKDMHFFLLFFWISTKGFNKGCGGKIKCFSDKWKRVNGKTCSICVYNVLVQNTYYNLSLKVVNNWWYIYGELSIFVTTNKRLYWYGCCQSPVKQVLVQKIKGVIKIIGRLLPRGLNWAK